ncbi:MDR family MFS transporter [Glycomyces buryatensis]|uniref:Multidrug efflux MFS transporter n=1 Tax=Glycomyces buryatensis TaxID=2570927 RepID=A0A4S8QHQ6_9ACTN|nr:MDR family MFS transporter [Glycomyces buryatensis]THV42505.1 multidrug efflux MFS transporter [Glycomyces buryatensis]
MSVAQETVEDTPVSTEETETGIPSKIKLVIGLLLAATFVMILNETVMSVALPRLMNEFSISAATVQWLTTGFMLTMAVVIPTTGLILQRFTTRAVFIAAMSLFTAGTLLAAVAPAFGVLVVARVVQASGTAVMLPLLMTTVLTFVPADRRGRTIGLISIVISVAPAIGPTFSGFILESLSWRWMFLAVLPIAALSLFLGAALVKNITEPKSVKIDLLSIVLSALTFGGLIYGLSSLGEAATEAGAPISPSLPLSVGAVSLVLFVWRQLVLQRSDAPLMDLRVFNNRPFAIGIAMMLISMATFFGSLILLPMYLQNVLELKTMETGLVLLPGGLAMGLSSPFIGRLYDRFGPRPLVTPGAIFVAIGLGLLTQLDQTTETSFVVMAHVLLMVGLACMMTPLMTNALGDLKPELYSHGSAIVNTLQQMAGAAGTALFITIMTTGITSEMANGADEIAAQAAGIHDAFIWGCVLAIVSVAASFMVKKAAAPAVEGAPAVH